MVISLDLDGVLVDFSSAICKALTKKTGREFTPENITNYKLEERIPPEMLGWFSSLLYDSKFYSTFKPMYGAKDLVKRLSMVYDIVIITARPFSLRESTERYVKKNFPQVSRVIFSPHKSSSIKEWGGIIHLEDNPEIALEVSAAGIPCCLIDHPFNQWLNCAESVNLYRVLTYKEFENVLSKIFKQNYCNLTQEFFNDLLRR